MQRDRVEHAPIGRGLIHFFAWALRGASDGGALSSRLFVFSAWRNAQNIMRIAFLVFMLALCGCEQKQAGLTVNQVEQLTQQIGQLNQKIDNLTTNLARVESGLNFEYKANDYSISNNFSKLEKAVLLGNVGTLEVLTAARDDISQVNGAVGKIDYSTSLADVQTSISNLKLDEDFNKQKLAMIFDAIQDVAHDQLDTQARISEISLKLKVP